MLDSGKMRGVVRINLKYKIEERDSQITLEVIKELGFDEAMNLACSRAFSILDKDIESILAIMLLAWSHNLLEDSYQAKSKEQKEGLRKIAYFYKKLSHKVYRYQRKTGSIDKLPVFLQSIR